MTTYPQTAETYIATLCSATGAVMCVPVDHATARRYVELHDILPPNLEQWPEAALTELILLLTFDDVEAYQYVLILLAHHRSERASELIAELRPSVPKDLASFAEIAYAESLSWQGLDYVRQMGWDTPLIAPAGQAVMHFREPMRH
ncbi:MAG: hypothetical protein AAFX99_20325 [Myxococcota bacterium]